MELFPVDSKFNFMRFRYVALTVSVILLIAAVFAFFVRGLNYDLDFTGGTLIEVYFEQPADVTKVRDILAENNFGHATVQNLGDLNTVAIRLKPINSKIEQTQETAQLVLSTLKKEYPAVALKRSDFVGPQVGKELAENGLLAVIFVAIGFMIYITARFEWKFALAAILATLHDVVVSTGYFAMTQHDFDLNVLAGILSVMGYSINDTIVVFDRARENFRSMHRITPMDLLNRTVNQTLSRTVITSLVAFLTVLSLYLFGGNALQGMAESLMLGIVLGTLSSIFFACPLLLWLGVTKQDLMPKAKDITELERRP